jgi:hypothetical protein
VLPRPTSIPSCTHPQQFGFIREVAHPKPFWLSAVPVAAECIAGKILKMTSNSIAQPKGRGMKIIFVLLVALSAVSVAAAGEAPKQQSDKFKITTKKTDDAVEVQVEEGKVVFSVKSPTGISQADIERTNEKWPDTVTLRLYLKGLEHIRASNSNFTLDAAVSNQNGKVRVWKDSKEDAPLDEMSPFWTDIRIVGGDGKPTKEIPLKDGFFEMKLPKAFFEGNPKSITVSWIDFYR